MPSKTFKTFNKPPSHPSDHGPFVQLDLIYIEIFYLKVLGSIVMKRYTLLKFQHKILEKLGEKSI